MDEMSDETIFWNRFSLTSNMIDPNKNLINIDNSNKKFEISKIQHLNSEQE